MRLIDADALMDTMYHEAFETDSDMQKWDGGCWIRYKMFERNIDSAPTIDTVSVVRCKECIWFETDNMGEDYCMYVKGLADAKADDFCSYGERKGE